MFERLMSLLERGGTLTVDQLARELDTSPEVVSGMIDHMARQGWLRALSSSCNAACGGCSLARVCGRREKTRTWVSTDDLQRMHA
jgi:hypothetical protein